MLTIRKFNNTESLKKKLKRLSNWDLSDLEEKFQIEFNNIIYDIDITYKKIFNFIKLLDENKFKFIFEIWDYFGIKNCEADISLFFKIIFLSKYTFNSGDEEKVFSHIIDFDLIFSLFLEKYKIDLTTDNINWKKYSALLENLLNSNNPLTKRIGYREGKNSKSKEERKLYNIFKIKEGNAKEKLHELKKMRYEAIIKGK